jgi:hypothetical protein
VRITLEARPGRADRPVLGLKGTLLERCPAGEQFLLPDGRWHAAVATSRWLIEFDHELRVARGDGVLQPTRWAAVPREAMARAQDAESKKVGTD